MRTKVEAPSGPPSAEVEPKHLFQDASSEPLTDNAHEIDWENNPLETRAAHEEPTGWTHAFFARFVPRKPTTPDDSSLREQLRELLREMEAGPPKLNREEVGESLEEWLRSIQDKVHPVEEVVVGSFGRHVAAWEELLKDSTRPTSRSVLLWIRQGIKPAFGGTVDCEAKKLDRIRRMLKRVMGESRVEEWLSGQVPHPVEFPNHRSFFENSDFAV